MLIASASVTARRYSDLPDRVPLHFGITGMADSFGPRWAIWLVVVLQTFLAVMYAGLYYALRSGGMLIASLGAGAILTYAQLQIVSAAVSGKNRIAIGPFLAVIAAIILAMAAATRLIR